MEKIVKLMLPFFAAATMLFGGMTVSADVIVDAYENESYSEEYDSDSGSSILSSLAIAAIVSGIIVGVMISGMKTTRPEKLADSYIKEGSFGLSQSRDVFLYSKVTKTKRESK